MAKLFGQTLTRQQVEGYTGRLLQVAGVKLEEWSEGSERGLRTAEVRSGSGLRFSVLLDRGLDIGPAEYRGMPLAWVSPTGFAAPAFFEPEGLSWLYGFGGGLLTGCGLTYLGAPNVDEGEALGLHGRLSNIPAARVNTGETWEGDECTIYVEGDVNQVRVHGEFLALHRRISTRLGSSVIRVEDTVENRAAVASPLMVLYHVNLGYPLLNEKSTLSVKANRTFSRDAEAEKGISRWNEFQKPTPGYAEQVFYHDVTADSAGWAGAELVSPDAGLKFNVRFLKDTLPYLVQWKMMGKGTYVLGLEPANCQVTGRAEERARGTLQFLQAGESRRFVVEMEVTEI